MLDKVKDSEVGALCLFHSLYYHGCCKGCSHCPLTYFGMDSGSNMYKVYILSKA